MQRPAPRCATSSLAKLGDVTQLVAAFLITLGSRLRYDARSQERPDGCFCKRKLDGREAEQTSTARRCCAALEGCSQRSTNNYTDATQDEEDTQKVNEEAP